MTTYSKARGQYLESEILSAGPVRRIQLLYEGAIDAIAKAREAQSAKDIRTRAAQVNKAVDILSELSLSLDHSSGEPMTRDLVELYDYAQRQLIEGSTKQLDAPFADAAQVMRTLLEAWKGIPEIEHQLGTGAAAPSDRRVPVDYGAGDTVSIGAIRTALDQLG